MIPLIVFYFHIVGFTFGFTWEFQKEGISAAFLFFVFMVLIFSVGWSISSFFLKFLISPEGFTTWLDRDALSLLLLTLAEIFFYFFYFKEKK